MKIAFDNNALGNLVLDKSLCQIEKTCKKIKADAEKAGDLIFADVTVCDELLRHLKNPKDRDYKRCKKSLYALYVLCSYYDNGRLHFRFNHTHLNLISRLVSGGLDPHQTTYERSIVDFIIHLSQKKINDTIIKEGKANCESLERDWVQNRDNLIDSFADNIFPNRDKDFIKDIEHDDFGNAVSLSFLLYAAKYFSASPSKENIVTFRSKVLPMIVFFRKFLKDIYNGLPQPGQKIFTNKKHERWNNISDYFIMISSLLSGSILITDEDEISKSYKDAGMSERVMTTDEYLKRIGHSNRPKSLIESLKDMIHTIKKCLRPRRK